jgi:hypothetical protein
MEQGSDRQGGNSPHGGHSAGRGLGISLDGIIIFFQSVFYVPGTEREKNFRLISRKVLLFVLWA